MQHPDCAWLKWRHTWFKLDYKTRIKLHINICSRFTRRTLQSVLPGQGNFTALSSVVPDRQQHSNDEPLLLPFLAASTHFLSLPWNLKLAVSLDIIVLLTQISKYTHEAHCKGLGLFVCCCSCSLLKTWGCPELSVSNKQLLTSTFLVFFLFLMTPSPCVHLDGVQRTVGSCVWQCGWQCCGWAGCWQPILPDGARGEGAKVQLRCEQLKAGIHTMRGN